MEQLSFDFDDADWDEYSLIDWIDRHIDYIYTNRENKLEFVRRIIDNLINERKFTLKQLLVSKFLLVKIIKAKIEHCEKLARKKLYQDTLKFDNADLLSDSDKYGFNYSNYIYYPTSYYTGNYEFKKHFYNKIGELSNDGEEFECARIIDSLPDVKYWVRNLAYGKEASFRLRTSSDYFYPDFVVVLNDGRILVIEYKGEPYKTNDDSKEKKLLGELWARKSNGKCLFLMVVKDDKGLSVKQQIENVIRNG